MGLLDEARAFRAKISTMAQFAPDEMILDEPMAFYKWKPGIAYAVGDVRRDDEGLLYRCLQAHTAQADWSPDVAVSLWVKIADPAIEYPAWVQPTGAQDAYQMGDKVTFEGKRYISKINANTWSPTAYPAGWEVQP